MKKILIIVSMFMLLDVCYAKEKVKFSKCVDGDTIKVMLDDKEYTVRMLAVDTPESVHPTKKVEYYGKEASEFTCNLVKNAKKLELEYDDDSNKMDKYDRLLAWVFVDSELLQEKLIESGYAKVAYLYGDYKYTKLLQEKQELASAKNMGVWNEEEKDKYNKEHEIEEDIVEKEDTKVEETKYSTTDIIIIAILIIAVVFVGDKSIKNSAKKKLKKYLK